MKSKLISLILTCLVVSSCSMGLLLNKHSEEKLASGPDFKSIPAGKLRKTAFIDFLSPLITVENKRVSNQRLKLFSIREDIALSQPLTSSKKNWLSKTATAYRVTTGTNTEKVARLTKRIDIIPPSLVLAQASIETAWGSSRFARQANNYFGQWCFNKGCGLVPLQRKNDAIHEVRSFNTPAESIRSYITNLNSHPAYNKLRQIRSDERNEGHYISGCKLTEGLEKYSELGLTYVESLKSIIRVNRLEPTQYLSDCQKLAKAPPLSTDMGISIETAIR